MGKLSILSVIVLGDLIGQLTEQISVPASIKGYENSPVQISLPASIKGCENNPVQISVPASIKGCEHNPVQISLPASIKGYENNPVQRYKLGCFRSSIIVMKKAIP
ncbi:hypothetical protein RRG08_015172 [Elysia crispata]|uniref:Uncharacterized protein n=1 Tax=Elysia crispata TaxID=231223 RepID=A0AAE1AZZ3_9GAST|nr:hypothetical protein RRG08_015172 [Elysia crispata]